MIPAHETLGKEDVGTRARSQYGYGDAGLRVTVGESYHAEEIEEWRVWKPAAGGLLERLERELAFAELVAWYPCGDRILAWLRGPMSR